MHPGNVKEDFLVRAFLEPVRWDTIDSFPLLRRLMFWHRATCADVRCAHGRPWRVGASLTSLWRSSTDISSHSIPQGKVRLYASLVVPLLGGLAVGI